MPASKYETLTNHYQKPRPKAIGGQIGFKLVISVKFFKANVVNRKENLYENLIVSNLLKEDDKSLFNCPLLEPFGINHS